MDAGHTNDLAAHLVVDDLVVAQDAYRNLRPRIAPQLLDRFLEVAAIQALQGEIRRFLANFQVCLAIDRVQISGLKNCSMLERE